MSMTISKAAIVGFVCQLIWPRLLFPTIVAVQYKYKQILNTENFDSP